MRELEKKLKDLQKMKYEEISIIQVLNWISEIRREKRSKKIEREEQYSAKNKLIKYADNP